MNMCSQLVFEPMICMLVLYYMYTNIGIVTYGVIHI